MQSFYYAAQSLWWNSNKIPFVTSNNRLGLQSCTAGEYSLSIRPKPSRYRPGVAQWVPGSQGSQISWQRHRMVVRLSDLRTSRIYPQEIFLVLISVRSWVDPRAIVRSEGFMSMKNSRTPSGIEPATFWFVPQYLNHCATAVPFQLGLPHKTSLIYWL
jgi:hypothetical protein